jgi:hypothetical protein
MIKKRKMINDDHMNSVADRLGLIVEKIDDFEDKITFYDFYIEIKSEEYKVLRIDEDSYNELIFDYVEYGDPIIDFIDLIINHYKIEDSIVSFFD